MLAEREKRLLRTVTGGGQAVGAKPYPGKKGDQGNMLTGLAAEWVQRGTQQGCAYRLHVGRSPDPVRRQARGEHTRSPSGASDEFRTCKSVVVQCRVHEKRRQAGHAVRSLWN